MLPKEDGPPTAEPITSAKGENGMEEEIRELTEEEKAEAAEEAAEGGKMRVKTEMTAEFPPVV